MRNVIRDQLWIGNSGDVNSLREFLNAGGRAFVHLAYEELAPAVPRELICCRFPLIDGEGNAPELLAAAVHCVRGLIGNSIPTLIACGGGMSRSPCIAAAALSLQRNQSLDESLAAIAGGGPMDVSATLWNDVVHVVNGMRSSES